MLVVRRWSWGTITATPSGPPVRLMAMVKRLLADRFKLRIHQETRQLPVYDLVVANADIIERPTPD